MAEALITHTKEKKSGHAFHYMKHFPGFSVPFKQRTAKKKKKNPAEAGADKAPAVNGDLKSG